jgi:uncharacterized membrane protein
MKTTRLEAFSDGVIAILITIMVLELKVPHDQHDHEATLGDLRELGAVFLAYVLSFVFVGIYWNNHHHMLHATQRVDGRTLWANLHLLFWLSLVPFATHWLGETHAAPVPTAVYGGVLLGAAIAYTILAWSLVRLHGPESELRLALGRDYKGKVSLAAYAAAIPLAFVNRWLAIAIYVAIALLWLVPDRRIESRLHDHG